MSSDVKTTTLCKIVLLGDTGVGKTSISIRFVQDTFAKYQEPTIGAAYLTKTLHRPNHSVKFEIWDTAGQERYRALVPLYYRSAQIAIVVYDISVKSSYEQAKIWINRVKQDHNSCLIFLVGNKSDAAEKRIISEDTAQQYAIKHNILFMEVSAKNGDHIADLFNIIADEVPTLPPIHRGGKNIVDVNALNGDTDSMLNKCCYG
tara:strand:- start:762 stop:1373 length:612 start_codon:yes stop_codon:yes gene_type:complete